MFKQDLTQVERDHQTALPADIECLAWAATILEVNEFKLFELAYVSWYGRQASVGEIELAFIRYLRTETLPVWVRHFTRRIPPEALVAHVATIALRNDRKVLWIDVVFVVASFGYVGLRMFGYLQVAEQSRCQGQLQEHSELPRIGVPTPASLGKRRSKSRLLLGRQGTMMRLRRGSSLA